MCFALQSAVERAFSCSTWDADAYDWKIFAKFRAEILSWYVDKNLNFIFFLSHRDCCLTCIQFLAVYYLAKYEKWKFYLLWQNQTITVFCVHRNYLHSFSQICEIPRNSAKIWPYSSSRSSKIIGLGINRKRIYDFLLVINCNFGRISYRFRDIDA